MIDPSRIRVNHYRYCVDDEGTTVLANARQIRENHLTVLARGGMTEAVILDDDGEVVSTGTAYCNDKDQYRKQIGREAAVGRALFPIERSSEAARRERRRAEEAGKEKALDTTSVTV